MKQLPLVLGCSLLLLAHPTYPMDNQHNQFDAPYYAQNSTPQYQQAKSFIDTIPAISPDSAILDIGCLDGNITARELAPLVPQGSIVGLDSDASMLAYAQQQYADRKNITWTQQKVEDMCYENRFNVITSFHCLHWISNIAQALENISRALKPNGTFYAIFDGAHPNNYFVQSVIAQINSDKWHKLFASHNMDNVDAIYHLRDQNFIATLLSTIKFNSIRCEIVPWRDTFTSEDHLYAWICGWCPYKNVLKNHHKEFWFDVLKEYTLHVPVREDGLISIWFFSMYVIAQKTASDN